MPTRHAGLGEVLAARSAHRTRDTEICDDGMAPFEQNVLRLDIAMDHASTVRVGQRVGYFAE